MHHNLYTRKFSYAAVALVAILTGCNGEGDNAANTASPGASAPATIAAQNATFITQHDAYYKVDLSDKVSVSDGKSFKLIDVTPLSQAAECYPLEQGEQSFTIVADSSMACTYEYKVAVTDGPSSATGSRSSELSTANATPTDVALTRVAVTTATAASSGTDLAAISAVAFVGQEITVDVQKELREQLGLDLSFNPFSGHQLDSDIQTPYSPNANVDVKDRTTIRYTPNSTFSGIQRILFSILDSDGNTKYLGTLDVAVVFEANKGLTTQKSTASDVKAGNLATIDVASSVTSLDNQSFQLVYVDSFNATTKPASELLTNTKFTFSSSVVGDHYVSYAVTDNNGAYAYGIIKVPVIP